MNKQEYTEIMERVDAGAKIAQDLFDEVTEFAKAKKIRRPKADAIAPVKKARKAAAPKAPKVKVACSVEGCEKDSRTNGMCATHYSKLIYRAKPENAEKARLASAKYAQRMRDIKAAAKLAAAA